MKREITVTVIVDTDDPLGLIRDDITQELKGCWHRMDSITVTEEEAACRNCVKSVAMNDDGIMFKCTAKEYDYYGMACFAPKKYDIVGEVID